jgi:hypothetical protein
MSTGSRQLHFSAPLMANATPVFRFARLNDPHIDRYYEAAQSNQSEIYRNSKTFSRAYQVVAGYKVRGN